MCYHLIMNFQIKECLQSDGSSPFGEWFAALDLAAAAKVSVAVARIEQGKKNESKGKRNGIDT